MNRRGFALLAVLWVITALTVLTGVALRVARTGWQTTRNRVLLARAGWAREACVEILLARYAADPTVRRVDTVDLGRGTWCRAVLEDPATKLNANVADREALKRLLSAISNQPSTAESILTARRRGPIYHLAQVPGMDSVLAARLAPFLTTRGAGAVNVSAAPLEVLTTLPGVSQEALQVILLHRDTRPIQGADELAALLSKPSRTVLLAAYPEFVRSTVFKPTQFVAVVEGGVHSTALRSQATLTVVPAPGRLAVIRRETE
jgi:type II secretory pathway component PulK